MGRGKRYGGLADVWHRLFNLQYYTQLIVCVENSKDVENRQMQVAEHFEVLKLFVLPDRCYHLSFKAAFEESIEDDRPPCRTQCPFYRGEHL